MRVLFTPSARTEFLAALGYLRERNLDAALRLRQRTETVLRRLKRFPLSGRVIPEFPDLPYREGIVPPYLLQFPGSPFIRYPHGISLHQGIDRILITSTVRPSDLGDPGETVTVLEASTGEVLSTHKVSLKPSSPGAAPVEVMFLHPSHPPAACITNMYEGTLWLAIWNPTTKAFTFRQVDDYTLRGQGIPLEMEHNRKGDRLYVTTAKPGHVNVYDISDPQNPKFLKAIPAAPGAHHLVFSPDERYLFVLKNQGLNPNSIVLLPARP